MYTIYINIYVIYIFAYANFILNVSVHISWMTYTRFSLKYIPSHVIHRSEDMLIHSLHYQTRVQNSYIHFYF